jgi:6,7-dimethyl-8-ribityllumazine synthase
MVMDQSQIVFDKGFTKKLRIAIVRTNYHAALVDNLESYARKTLLTAGVKEKNIRTFTAPGAWELPPLVKKAAEKKKFDAILTFGVIIKGETLHFDLIASEVTSALMQLSIDFLTPIAFEVLAVYDKKHAEARAGDNDANKGIEAANAALLMVHELTTI